MKFSQILEKGKDAILIEEWFEGKIVGPHTSHGFGDDEDSNCYFLYFDGKGGYTSVLIDQEVKIENNSVFCVDTNGNNIELRFFLGVPISFENP